MPWVVRRNSKGGYDIVKADTGKVVGHSDSKESAEASVRARYANTPEAQRGGSSSGNTKVQTGGSSYSGNSGKK